MREICFDCPPLSRILHATIVTMKCVTEKHFYEKKSMTDTCLLSSIFLRKNFSKNHAIKRLNVSAASWIIITSDRKFHSSSLMVIIGEENPISIAYDTTIDEKNCISIARNNVYRFEFDQFDKIPRISTSV